MSNTARRSQRILASALCALMLLGSLFSSGIFDLIVHAEGEPEEPEITVGFESLRADANENNVVIFTVALTDLAPTDVTVYYHTENRSSFAPSDFTAVTSSVVIPKGKIKAEIAIKMITTVSCATIVGGVRQTKHFALVLDRADGAKLDEKNSTALGYQKSVYTYPATLSGTYGYLSEYANIQTATYKDIRNIDGGETWASWDKGVSLNNETTRKWWDEYYTMSDVYGTLLVKSFSYDANWSSSKPRIIMGNKDFIDMDNHGRWDPGVVAWWEIDPCYNSLGCRLDGYANEIFALGKNPHDTDSDYWDKVNYEGDSDRKQIYFYNEKDGWYADAGALYHSMFYRITPVNGIFDIGVTFYNSASWQDYQLFGFTVKMLLQDSYKPSVQRSVLDTSSLATTGMLRLIIQFSEPVQVNRENTSISVRFNGSNVNKNFTYAGGNYTDTLYYEWKAERKDYVSCEYDIEVTNFDYISDMAYNVDSYGKASGNRIDEVKSKKVFFDEINYTAPEIEFTPKTSGWSKYHEVDVSTGSVSSGTLYYLWNDSPDELTKPEDYGSNKIDFIQPLTTLSFSGVNGSYYLHVLVETPLGLSAAATYDVSSAKAFRFDNTPPVFSAVNTKNVLQTKYWSLDFYDAVGDSVGGGGIERLTMTVSDTDGKLVNTYVLYDSASGKKDPCLTLHETDGVFNGVYRSPLMPLTDEETPAGEGDTVAFPADEKIISLMGEEKRMDFLISFTLKDLCGNSVTTRKEKYTYDLREGFETTLTVGESLETETDITDIDVYNINEAENVSVSVSCAQENGHLRLLVHSLKTGSLEGILYNGEQISERVDATGDDLKSITLSGLTAGEYEILPFFELDTEGEAEEALVAPTIKFVITADRNEETANYTGAYKSNLVLTNKVYRLPDSSFWYLGAVGSNPSSHAYGAVLDGETGKYVGGSTYPAFSNLSEMRDYVTYMEYQDMYLVSITSAVANFLNSGTGSTVYVKADGESKFAQAGQLWIRYKRPSWTPSSNSYGWVFYYYGEGDVSEGIDIRSISSNLRNSVYAVRDTICREAEIVYLVGEEYVSSVTGAPMLKESQTHVLREEATGSKMGNVFAVAVSYDGDGTLYSNFVKDADGKEYPLATNLILNVSPETRLYAKYGTEGNWTALNAVSGKPLRAALDSASGIYTLLEIDENGVREYEVYSDTDTPVLKVLINDEERIVEAETMQYSGSTFSFAELSGEIDEYAYVAVYAYNTGLVKEVYYKNDLIGKELSGSNYYIEIGDRSGNSFMFVLRLASSELKASAELSSGGNGVVVTVEDRMESEIYRYEVYCNNELVTSEYVQKKLYTVPGIYSVFIQDIYGNVFRSDTITFNRRSPDISWYYKNIYDIFTAYNPDNVVSMMITDDTENIGKHYVSTSALVRFRIAEGNGNIKYEFTDIGEEDYNVDTTGNTVTVNRLSGWTLKVWYEDSPENYETYVCVVDDKAPTIDVSYIGSTFTPDELATLGEALPLIPSVLTYSEASGIVRSVSEGEVFDGSYITISASDEFGVRSLIVSCNGNTVTAIPEDGVYHLSDRGNYVVTATDMFGNTGVFRFTNTDKPSSEFSTDGKTYLTGSLTEKLYGDEAAYVSLIRDAETEFLIVGDDEVYYYRFRLSSGNITAGSYAVSGDGEEERIITVWNPSPLVSASDEKTRRGQWYTLSSETDFEIQVRFSEDGEVTYRVLCVQGTEDIQIRTMTGSGFCPDYRNIVLSKERSDIKIVSDGAEVNVSDGGEPVYVNAPFTFGDVTDPLITKIEVSYSAALDFREFLTVYETGDEKVSDFDCSEKGFWCVKITNAYGNVTEYLIRYSDSAEIIVTAEYTDGYQNKYTAASDGKTVYSNGTVTVDVYGSGVCFKVNGEEAEGVYSGDISRIMFYNEGTYSLEITDATGKVTNYVIDIGSAAADFAYDGSWITGYNPKARSSEGYTNTVLSVVPDLSKVCLVFVRFEDETEIIYDTLAEKPKNSLSALAGSVGKLGDGTYTVGFRNKYGDTVTKDVYIRFTPTLVIERVTALSGAETVGDIASVVKNGIYSSNSITFSTKAEKYKFTVNKETVSLEKPKIYEFTSSSGNGSFEYDIYYIDEYGFEYNFKACLYRQTVIINTDGMKVKEIDGALYTTGDVFVTFKSDETATVSFNGEEAVPYASGERLFRDGTYRFTVTDKAGNVSGYFIERDSVVKFSFTEALSERQIISGGVVNNSSVVFHTSLGDSSFITKVFLDGKEQKEFDGRFAGTGKWEIMLADEIGNTAYFCFYVLGNAVSRFDYEAPYGYTVAEVWHTDKDGNRQLTTNKGSRIELTENGDYAVIMLSEWDNTAVNFTVTVNTTPPDVKLVGCENGEETAKIVTLSGLSAGDTVIVYKDGKFVREILIEMSSDIPSFETGGKYDIIVKNKAGVEKELTFTKKYIANTAASVLVIIACFAVATGVFVGLLYRNRSKTDE